MKATYSSTEQTLKLYGNRIACCTMHVE